MSRPRWDGLLLDIDGVLHVGAVPLDGATAVLSLLAQRRVPYRLVTNTTSRSRRLVVERLREMGFEIVAEEVLTPAALAVRRCRARGYARVALHVSPALVEDLEELGDYTEQDPQAVIVGDLGDEFTPARLNAIFRQLQAGAELIALQRNRVWQSERGLTLDAGPFVAALEYATGREAVVTGKPSAEFFSAAIAELGLTQDPPRVAMIGDDIEADVGGALEAGLDGILVKTGKYRDDVAAASDVRPTLVLPSIAELPEYLDA